MSSARVSHGDAAVSGGRSWRVGLLTRTEPGRRNRRMIDSVLLFWAAIVVGLSAAIAASAPVHDRRVGDALKTVFGWAGPFWRAAFFVLLALAAAIVVEALVKQRWDLVRDVLVAVGAVFCASVLLGRAVESDWLPV